jgi:hypothetical protein
MIPTVPQAPSAARNTLEALRPEDYNPDIAAAKMAQELVRQMGAPAVLSKEFVVRKGIWEGLNHREPVWDKDKLRAISEEIEIRANAAKKANPTAYLLSDKHPNDFWIEQHQNEYEAMVKTALIDPGNRTGYDCSLRIAIYNNVAKNSVNIDGKYFLSIWQYLMKPKYTIVQPGSQPSNSFDDQPSLGRRLLNKLTGASNNGTTNQ